LFGIYRNSLLKTAVCMLLAVGFFMETAVTAYAQRWLDEQSDVIRPRDDTKNFFDIFNFDSGPGFRERRPYRDRPREDRRSDGDYRSDERESRGAEPKIIQVQKPKIEPKNPDASVVLVLGDTMAEQLALGLKDAYSKQPNLRIENVSVEGLGLVSGDGQSSWLARVPSLLQTQKLAAIVVSLGVEDVTSIPYEGRSVPPNSPAWEGLYKSRVRLLSNALVASGRPVFWVGLPPMQDATKKSNAALINDYVQDMLASSLARYIDVWNSFLDENGAYTSRGPDLEGVVRLLRSSDGVHFTSEGRRKYAHFVERFIKPDEGSNLAIISYGDSFFQGIASAEADRGPVISLTDTIASPTAELLSDKSDVEPKSLNAKRRLVLGLPMDVPAGRADNFRLPDNDNASSETAINEQTLLQSQ
jgi:hypothetical protein